MTNIPEDSMLRRHYLTELKNKPSEDNSNFHIYTTAAFMLLLVVIFL
jgi:hypothetical protein